MPRVPPRRTAALRWWDSRHRPTLREFTFSDRRRLGRRLVSLDAASGARAGRLSRSAFRTGLLRGSRFLSPSAASGMAGRDGDELGHRALRRRLVADLSSAETAANPERTELPHLSRRRSKEKLSDVTGGAVFHRG